MLNKNEIHRLPDSLKWYQLANLILMALLFAIPFSLFPGASYWGIVWGFLIFIMLPVFVFLLLDNNSVSFVFDNDKITINSGIVVKNSKIMPYDKVQNVNVKSGALLGMFGLSEIEIWTASQSQMGSKGETKPDGRLKLHKEDSKILADTILKKGN